MIENFWKLLNYKLKARARVVKVRVHSISYYYPLHVVHVTAVFVNLLWAGYVTLLH